MTSVKTLELNNNMGTEPPITSHFSELVRRAVDGDPEAIVELRSLQAREGAAAVRDTVEMSA